MNYCQRCIIPNTRPNIEIGGDGICNACIAHLEKEEINWSQREETFQKVIEHAKSKSRGYDCLIPVSGGKDSTWQVVKCLEKGLNPLCVTWKPPGRTQIGQENLDNLIGLGVDHMDYSINPQTEKNYMLEALRRNGSPAVSARPGGTH